jgi:Flp pilus assembly protein TadG
MTTRKPPGALRTWRDLFRDDDGGALVDYAIVASAFGAIVLTSFALVQTGTANNLVRTQNNLTSVAGTP